ncbi:MAG: hypothetical protein COY40_00390 [Alphaproteobacteria bacterium CG_4_10_14_0_8_um_filter_53_9]|nr:MAG: hypothetical protein COY40_00390 [Alphaproteobacteria bacterium CG_4_10_14_0_8_um_filter_53_9]
MDGKAYLQAARTALSDALAEIGDESVVPSHVGFRSETAKAWENTLADLKPLGTVYMTFKPDGREIPFVKLGAPLEVGGHVLEYLEVPAPKWGVVDEPSILVVFTHPEREEKIVTEIYDIRLQAMHARDFIARDKGRVN